MAKKNRKTSWLGGGQNIEPQTDASTATSDVIMMIPPTAAADIPGPRTTFLIEAIYLHFSVHRLLITEVDALGFMVYQIPPSEAGNLPSLALDSLSLQDRLYARKNIMMMAPLPFPGIFLSSDLGSATVMQEGLVAHHEFQAMRKHDTNSQVLALTVNSDVSVVFNVFCQWRILVSWS